MPQRNIHVIISLFLLLFCSLQKKNIQKSKNKGKKRNIEYKVENESLVYSTIIYCVLKNINLINNI